MSSTQPDGPPLIRPIPQRPFGLNVREPTPPDEEGDSSPPSPKYTPPTLNLETLNSRLLDVRSDSRSNSNNNNFNAPPSESGPDGSSISRAQSVLNLTGSTLMGIYTPSTYGPDRFYSGGDRDGTPWGTGAETPYALNTNPETAAAMHRRRRSSLLHPHSPSPLRPAPAPMSASAFAFHLGLRAVLLAALGVLYGILVARVLDRFHVASASASASPMAYDARYVAFWGASGVLLGGLLPWFDGVWDRAFGLGSEDDVAEDTDAAAEQLAGEQKEAPVPGPDWSLAVRGIGAFAGIAFALRKLSWDSTLQVSATLALVNPALWYLIDRSVPGLLMAAAVGLGGSALLTVPVLAAFGPWAYLLPSASTSAASSSTAQVAAVHQRFNGSSPHLGGGDDCYPLLTLLGGLGGAHNHVLESAVWMLSILFCCVVCFGNVGRWLALGMSGQGRSSASSGRGAKGER
ncbi:hypothetical protein DL766_008948 [Monosporascus sp. MC13-8B]|nr:hypothetical protein DL763_004107 [Monosporascus cannonballus]RYP17285.1 hypothetical protein DL766_008948 [Monosporascus sp. MC13-8B]